MLLYYTHWPFCLIFIIISFSRIKDKINHPPKKQDYQELSHNFSEFVKRKTNAKLGKIEQVVSVEDVPGQYYIHSNSLLIAAPFVTVSFHFRKL